MIRCTLCDATASTPVGRSPQDEGWTQITVNGPKANRYLSACPTHAPADVAAWVKAAIAAAKGKR